MQYFFTSAVKYRNICIEFSLGPGALLTPQRNYNEEDVELAAEMEPAPPISNPFSMLQSEGPTAEQRMTRSLIALSTTRGRKPTRRRTEACIVRNRAPTVSES